MQALAARMPSWKAVALAAVVVVLAGVAGYALLRELAKQPAAPQSSAAAAFTGGLAMHQAQGALTPEEEAFAASLWPIHSEVKLGAVRMIFAGIKYKTGEHDASTLKASVEPLVQVFDGAAVRTRKLTPPASLADEHNSYLRALDLYMQAAQEMVKVATDGRDEHLVEAQRQSEVASIELLKLSDPLWPGEYKPN
jgi:hypothetical protein